MTKPIQRPGHPRSALGDSPSMNCPDRLLADAAGFADRMASLLDLEANRLRQWLFARCVLDSPDRPFLGGVAAALAP